MTVQELYQQKVKEGLLKPDPVQINALDWLETVRKDLTAPVKKSGFFRRAPDPIKGLYMWGGVGRGKSMLMDLLFETVEAPKERWHFHAFMQWMHAEMAEVRKTGADDALVPVAKKLADRIRFLAFDEMQITDITDAVIVGRMFETLFGLGVVIVTTSNRPPDDLYKNGLNRDLFVPSIAIIKEHMAVQELASDVDHRQGRISGTQRYFSPSNAAAKTAIEEVWSDLTNGQAKPLDLTVKGRTLTLPEFHNGVARASFFDLCGRPLGPADYLALAEAIRVLVIVDIPLLSRQNFNEAKRFVTLVDALYEARVQLFATAAARPEMLYIEGEGTFEFARTASRLEEMQSDSWGQVG